MLGARLASIESELAADDVDEELLPPARSASPAPPISSASPGADAGPEAAPQRSGQAKPASAGDPSSQPADDGEDFLIEPGAGAPQRAREARDLAQVIGPKTNPAVSVHIAAARRAAQAALAENNAALNSGVVQTLASSERVQFAARGVQSARAFYANHRRTVLLGVAIAIATTLAVRMVGVRAPFLQRSELGGQAVNTAKLDAPKGKPSDVAGAIKPGGEAIDVAPTASIAQPPAKPTGSILRRQRAFCGRAHAGDPARDFCILARRDGRRPAQCAIRTRDASVRRPGTAEGSVSGGPVVRTRRLARPCPGAVSAWLDVREGNWRDPRPGGRETLVPQGG